jgi:hypothetical protein
VILVVALTSGFAEPRVVLAVGNVPDNIKPLLADYSQNLNTGQTSNAAFTSGPMKTLINDRKNYYNEYFDIGLHTKLISIKSEFQLENSIITKTSKALHIELLETLTMLGYPNLGTAEDYPMIPAAHWAISNTENSNVKQALTRYLQSTSDEINKSISNGNVMYFRVYHKMDIDLGGTQPQIIKDEFTNKEVDNGDGDDNVSWNNGVAIRTKPDLSKMLGYTMYHTPVEILGQSLLNDYTKAYGNRSTFSPASGFTYNRSVASNYAYTYVSANPPSNGCSYAGNSYYMATPSYNQITVYKNVWSWTTSTCDDCADYVSQALHQGNFPFDSNWAPNIQTGNPLHYGTYAWTVSDYSSNPWGLFYWLDAYWGATTQYSSSSSLQIGDIVTASYYSSGGRKHGAGHVVMITSVGGGGPYYSGHTNDRKGVALSGYPSLAYYWHIYDNLQ